MTVRIQGMGGPRIPAPAFEEGGWDDPGGGFWMRLEEEGRERARQEAEAARNHPPSSKKNEGQGDDKAGKE